jgi:tetratricopeptide (TPR) repeat protein
LENQPFFGWLQVDRLELEIPHVAFPLHLTGGALRFQRRRCRVANATLAIDDRALSAWLRGQAEALLSALFDEVHIRLLDGHAEISGRTRCQDRHADFTARVYAEPTTRGLRVMLADVRVFGSLPKPAALLGHELLCTLAGIRTDEAPADRVPMGTPARVLGLCDVELFPLESFLWHALPPSGWRLPAADQVRILSVELTRGRAFLRYGVGEASLPARSRRLSAHLEATQAYRLGDDRVLASDLDGATQAYLAAMSERGRDAPLLYERLLGVLAARESTLDRAEELSREATSRWRDFAFPHLTLAQIALERGRGIDAADHYARVLELAEAAGDDEEAVRAALAAARRLVAVEPRRATPFYERVLERRPALAEAAQVLAERYNAEERWADLVLLLRRRLTQASERADQARIYVSLGEVYLSRLGDAERAREELEHATRLAEDLPLAWETLGRAHDAVGEPLSSIKALDRLAQLYAKERDVVSEAWTHARIASQWEHVGDDANAHQRLKRAEELLPGDVEILERLAQLATQRGRTEEALGAYERLANLPATDEPRRLRAQRELARLYGEAGQLDRARELLALAQTGHADDFDVLAQLALLEEKAGNLETADSTLARAAALKRSGTRAAEIELRRARILSRLGRQEDQEKALERAYRCSPDDAAGEEALRALALLARERADAEDEALWLDALLRLGRALIGRGDLALRRAELFFAGGEADKARELCEEALRTASDPNVVRALFAEVLGAIGDNEARAEILDALAEETADNDERAHYLCAASEARLASGDHEGALGCARRATALAPHDTLARRALGEAAFRARAWDDVVAAYDPLLGTRMPEDGLEGRTSALDPNLRAELARRLGTALERRGRERDAALAYRLAVTTPGATGEAVTACFQRLAELCERLGDYRQAAETLSMAATDPRTQDSPETRAQLHFRAADLLRTRLGALPAAILELDAALAACPTHLPSLDALEAVSTDMRDPDRVALVLSRKAEAMAAHPDRQKAVLVRLAELQHRVLGQDDQARASYRRTLALDAEFRPALRFLAADARRQGRLAEAQALYERLAALPEGPVDDGNEGVDLTYERSEALSALGSMAIQAGRLGEAERHLKAALELAPASDERLILLEQVYLSSGRLAEAADVLARRAAQAKDAAFRLGLEARRIEILGERIGDYEAALSACRSAASAWPEERVVWNLLARTARAADSPTDLAVALEILADKESSHTTRRAYLLEAAELFRVRLAEPDKARALCEELLATDEYDLGALDLLLRLAEGRGDADQVAELLRLRDAQGAAPEGPSKALLDRAHRLLDDDDVDGALALLSKAQTDTASPVTIELLLLRAEVYEAKGRWRDAHGDLSRLRDLCEAQHDVDQERQVTRRLAALTLERLHDETAATWLYQRALAIDDDDIAAAEALASIYERHRDLPAYQASLEVVLTIARRTEAGADRLCELLREIARVFRASGDLLRARDRLDEASLLAGGDPQVLRDQAEIALALGDYADAARFLELVAQGERDRGGEALGPLYLQLFALYDERLDDRARACRALRHAAEALSDPAQQQAVVRRLGAYAIQAGAYEHVLWALPLLPSLSAQDRLALARAQMALGQDEQAVASLEAAQAEEPLDDTATATLFSLYRRFDRTSDLASALVASAQHTTDPLRRADRLREALSLYKGPLSDPLGASHVLTLLSSLEGEGASALDGASESAASLETELPTSPSELRELVRATPEPQLARFLAGRAAEGLLMAASAEADPRTAARWLAQASELYRTHLDDPRAAAHALSRALTLVPFDASLLAELAQVLRELGDFAALVGAYELHLGTLRDAARAPILYELGRIFADAFGEAARAATHFALAHAADPAFLPVLVQLGDFHYAEGESAPAEDYYRRALAEGALGDDERASVVARIGELTLRRGDAQDAIRCFRAALEHDPLFHAAWAWLDHALRAAEDWEGLLAHLYARARDETDPEERRARLLEAVELLEGPLARSDEAADVRAGLGEVSDPLRLPMAPPEDSAMVEFSESQTGMFRRRAGQRAELRQAQQWGDLLVALVEDSALAAKEQRAALFSEAARVAAGPLGDLKSSVNYLTSAIAATEFDEERGRLSAERAEIHARQGHREDAEDDLRLALSLGRPTGHAHLAMGRLKLADGDAEAALPHLLAATESVDLDPRLLGDAHFLAGQVQESIGRIESALSHFDVSSALCPYDERPLDALYRLAEARGDYDLLSELIGRQILIAPDPQSRAELWLRRAHLYRDVLVREPEAYRCLKEAFANDSSLVSAAHELRAMATTRGEWALCAELLYREIDATESADDKAELHMELGLVYEERILDVEAAIRNYETAFALAPQAPTPPAALARLYGLVQRPEDAARAEEAAARHETDAEARAARLLRAGELFERAKKPDVARRLFADLAREAGGAEATQVALAKLQRLESPASDPAVLGVKLESRLHSSRDAGEKLSILRELLELALAKGDPAAIETRAREILFLDPRDTAAFVARRQILTDRSDWLGVMELSRLRADAVEDPIDRAELYFAIGRSYAERFNDPARAALDLEQALHLNPAHPGALDTLADIAYRLHDWERAQELYQRIDAAVSSLGADVVHYRRGELCEVLGNEEDAEAQYRAAIVANPSHLSALEALARLALYRGEIPAAITALTGVLELLAPDDVERITTVRQQLGDLCHRAGDTRAARSYYELVLAEDSTRVAALAPLVEIHSGAGQWAKAAETLGRLSYVVTAPEKRADLLFRMGEIYRIHLGEEDRASEAYLKAIDLDPKHIPTMRRLIDYYWATDELSNLGEIASELDARSALTEAPTAAETVARVAVAAALGGNTPRGRSLLATLGGAATGVLAATLAEAAARRPHEVAMVVGVARSLCQPPGPSLGAVKAVLQVRGPQDPAAQGLAQSLEVPLAAWGSDAG